VADLHDSTEHYLSTIFEIEEEGIEIKRARIAERLGISAPSVTEHIHRMEKQGLIKVNDDNSVALTKSGMRQASSVVRKHRLAERLLVDIIGLDWEDAHKEADRWEHVISEAVEEKLVELLGDPQTCPHGNPIPDPDGSLHGERLETLRKSVPLSELGDAKEAIIRRIGERIEVNEDALHFVASHELKPGVRLIVSSRDQNDIVISIDGKQKISVPQSIGQSMFVETV
jgi:DtxR family Mn-dependent transcriptional regulator